MHSQEFRFQAAILFLQTTSPDLPTAEEYHNMRRALLHSQSEVQQLIQANKNLQLEVERLNNMVNTCRLLAFNS